MKKIIAFLFALIITAFSFSSCKHEYENRYDTCILYCTFEELLKDYTHEIVVAEFNSLVGEEDGNLKYKFKVKETIFGEDLGNTLYVFSRLANVSVTDTDISYNGNNSSMYKKGEEYILLISRYRSVYNKEDDVLSILESNAYLPLNDLKKSTVYNEPLTKHSQLTENDLNPESLIAYIKNIKKDDTNFYWGCNYIKSDALDDIVTGSDYVVELEIGEEVYKDASPVTDAFNCTVTKVYKGDIDVGKEFEYLIFLQNTVKTGKKYIVCLLKAEDGYEINIAAKKGVYSVGKAEKIEEILKNAPAQ